MANHEFLARKLIFSTGFLSDWLPCNWTLASRPPPDARFSVVTLEFSQLFIERRRLKSATEESRLMLATVIGPHRLRAVMGMC
jgi:hypothetical protein